MAETSKIARFLAGTHISSEIEEEEILEEDPYMEGFGELVLKKRTILKTKRIVDGEIKEMTFELP